MVAAAIERVRYNPAKQEPIRVGIFGGIHESRASLNRSARPLLEAGYRVASIEGRWFSGETTRKKLARGERFLNEWQPQVLYGPSAGGLWAVVAGFDHPSVERIVTAAAPLRWPSFFENTPKLRAIETAVPALWGLGKEYRKRVMDHLSTSRQHFLHFRGLEDEMVPPDLSWMLGSDGMMHHIEHTVFPTPPRAERGPAWAHTINTRDVVKFPRFQAFVAGNFAAAA